MSFDSLLNKKCTLQQKTETQGSGGEQAETWTPYATGISCRIGQASGREVMTAEGKMVVATHIIYMRPRKVGERDNRAVIDNNIYDILSVEDAAGHGDHLEIAVKRVYNG